MSTPCVQEYLKKRLHPYTPDWYRQLWHYGSVALHALEELWSVLMVYEWPADQLNTPNLEQARVFLPLWASHLAVAQTRPRFEREWGVPHYVIPPPIAPGLRADVLDKRVHGLMRRLHRMDEPDVDVRDLIVAIEQVVAMIRLSLELAEIEMNRDGIVLDS